MTYLELQLVHRPQSFRHLPASAVPDDLLTTFCHRSPDPLTIHEQVWHLRCAMNRLLSSKQLSTTRRETVPFWHDVFQLFGNLDVCCHVLPEFSLERFSTSYFPPDWYARTSKSGDAFFPESIYVAPHLYYAKPTHADSPTQPKVLVPVPFSVLHSEVVLLKVIILPCA